MPILPTHVILFFLIIRTMRKWSYRVVCLTPSSDTCYLCDLNKLYYAFWNSVTSSVSTE